MKTLNYSFNFEKFEINEALFDQSLNIYITAQNNDSQHNNSV